ncbi:MAG: sporulation protein YqfD [Eubacterium sp.]
MNLNFIKGYCSISTEQKYIKRLINLCGEKHIRIWDMVADDKYFSFFISIDDFKNISEVLRKNGIKFKVEYKRGLPVIYSMYKHKWIFAAGIIFFSMIIFILSLFIWDISFTGNYTYTDKELTKAVSTIGIVHGIKKSEVNCDDIETFLRNEYFDITWVSAEIKGTRIIIHINENTDDYIESNGLAEPCDISAVKDGIITSIITRSGIPLVKEGDIIKKGDILISGTINVTNEYDEPLFTKYVTSDADIYMQCSYQYSDIFSLKHKEKVYSDTNTGFFVSVGENRLTACPSRIFTSLFSQNSDKFFENIEYENQLKLFYNYYLPIYWGKISIKNYTQKDVLYTKEEAKIIAEGNLLLYLEKLEEKGVQIIENNVKITISNDTCLSIGEIIVIEKTGACTDINFNQEGPTDTDEHN